MKILNRYTDEAIYEEDVSTMKELVENAIKKGVNLSEADLREVDLSKADLNGVNLHGADLSVADLSEANLSKANLYGADLHGARHIRTFRAGDENRLCFTYVYRNVQRYQLGCFNGTLDEGIEAIKKKYGEDSQYERIVRAYEGL